ncbi:Uncharacterized protein APZ42_023039 [Daphnia magna]|uniref:Uncharacterized protein n=1 Tax=Daphnia magna TaxID=35525 RepID=A0A164V9N2_9CRUS|nr:Uncharacterized protein APZ42_023039 [Daphnia magna]
MQRNDSPGPAKYFCLANKIHFFFFGSSTSFPLAAVELLGVPPIHALQTETDLQGSYFF